MTYTLGAKDSVPASTAAQDGLESVLTLSVEELGLESFRKLVSGEILVLRVRGFYPREVADELGDRLLESDLFGYYVNAPAIGRVGMSFYETVGHPELMPKYFERAVPYIQTLRKLCFPYANPVDRLRLELEELWPKGCELLRTSDGRAMFVGLARVFKEGSEALPHLDRLVWDAPEGLIPRQLVTQLTNNTYLKLPEGGGELELWDLALERGEHRRLQIPGSYGISRDSLPTPKLSVQPEVGDLILFNSARLHAVRPPVGGDRVTLSCFIGIPESERESLVVWS